MIKSKPAVFLALIFTQTISLLGSHMTTVGIGFWVFSRTGSATSLLLTAFFTELPGMIFSSLAGVLVDRWPRKAVMILADAGQAVGSVLLYFSLISGNFQIWQLYVVSFFQGTFATFQSPAENATVTLLIPDNWRERANGLKETIFPLAGIGAPVFAGLLYTWIGVEGIILVDLATFGIAITILLLLRLPSSPVSAEGSLGRGSLFQEWLSGLRYLRRRPALGYFLLFNFMTFFLLNGPLTLNIPYLLSRVGDANTVGSILGILSLGAFCGALLMVVWGGTRPRIHTIMIGLLVSGVMFICYGVSRQQIALSVVTFLLFLPLPFSGALFTAIVQRKVPPDLQGRVFAINEQLGFAGATISFLLTGPLVDQFFEPAVHQPGWSIFAPFFGSTTGAGMGLLLALTGIVLIGVTAAAYAWPQFRNLERDLPDYDLSVKP